MGLAERGDNFQLRPGVEKVALSKDLRSGWAATLWPPHHSPWATRAALCRRAQNWGPSTGRGGLPSRVTSALGLGHQTPAVYTGREGSSSAREGTWQCTQICSPRPAVSPGCARVPHTLGSLRAATGRAKFPRAQRAARLTCDVRHKRAEPEQTGVEGRGHPRHGARRSAGARGGDGAGLRPGTATACRALNSGSRRPRPGWPAPRRHHPPCWPAGTPGIVAAQDALSPSPRAPALRDPSLLPRPPAPTLLCFLLPSLPRAATRSVYG